MNDKPYLNISLNRINLLTLNVPENIMLKDIEIKIIVSHKRWFQFWKFKEPIYKTNVEFMEILCNE